MKNDIGVFGLGVMGQNLALNFSSRGFNVAVYNRSDEGEEKIVSDFISSKCKNIDNIEGYNNLKNFILSLKNEKVILLMIQAGKAVDCVIKSIVHYLDKGDIIIDGGNSNYKDTERRYASLKEKGIEFVGCGISGGSEGALNGPSIMPGCSLEVWFKIQNVLQKIAATGEKDIYCQRIGSRGAGHFTKMVHNGIEYSVMQILAEVYDIQKNLLNMGHHEIHQVFSDWNEKELKSYLMKISADIVILRDKQDAYLLDSILDVASHKGTGKETSIASLELGIPSSMTTQAVYARYISSYFEERKDLSKIYLKEKKSIVKSKEYIEKLFYTTYIAIFLTYYQGLVLIKKASKANDWEIDLCNVVKVWKGGCIIQSELLYKIESALMKDTNLLVNNEFSNLIESKIALYREVVSDSILFAVPTPVLSAGITFFDSITNNTLPTNFIQAQRDYFGEHGFEKIDEPRGKIFHIKGEYENL